MEKTTEVVGWISALLLALTISRQVYTQWRTKSVAGVSKWLFVGQLAASLGFTIYSWLVQNWVFVVTNTFMVLTALVGQAIYLGNRRRAARQGSQVNQNTPAGVAGKPASASAVTQTSS